MFLELDGIEFAHIRLLCLLNPNKCYPSDLKLKSHHKQITENLQNYEEKYQNGSRIITILQATSVVNTIDAKTVEKLFFNILVDFIKIDHVIPYIINLNGSSKEFRQNIKTEDVDSIVETSFLSKHNEESKYYGDF